MLVGLDVDKKLFSMLEYAQSQEDMTGDEKADRFFELLRRAQDKFWIEDGSTELSMGFGLERI